MPPPSSTFTILSTLCKRGEAVVPESEPSEPDYGGAIQGYSSSVQSDSQLGSGAVTAIIIGSVLFGVILIVGIWMRLARRRAGYS
ncbi:MAG: hypothetical protein M1821_005610 [Bathelium mastoideum]|nr:MAG: hypothetical protein M1821_005610 [Bathelium mastoideum]